MSIILWKQCKNSTNHSCPLYYGNNTVNIHLIILKTRNAKKIIIHQKLYQLPHLYAKKTFFLASKGISFVSIHTQLKIPSIIKLI